MTSKICSKCNIGKELGEFHKDKSRKDGLSNRCKECRNIYSRQYTIENKESISANKKEYRKKNTEVIKERNKKYNEKKKLEKKNEEKLVVNSKKCSKCNVDKDIVEFHKDHRTKDGHKSICKECRNPSKKSKIPVIELDPTQKLCPACKIVKQVEMFSKHKARSDGLQRECKECYKAKAKNKKHIEYKIKSCSKCGIEKTSREFHKNNANSDGLTGQCMTCRKSYKANNKERDREVSRKWKKERKNIDFSYKIKENLRRRLNAVLKGMYKIETTKDLIGCSWEDVNLYLNEKTIIHEQFDVDHIIPCSVFNFTDSTHQKACFHYTNLQKLPSRENQHQKRNKLPDNFNVESWVKKQLEQIKKIEYDNLGWETVLELQKTKTFQGFIDEEDKWW